MKLKPLAAGLKKDQGPKKLRVNDDAAEQEDYGQRDLFGFIYATELFTTTTAIAGCTEHTPPLQDELPKGVIAAPPGPYKYVHYWEVHAFYLEFRSRIFTLRVVHTDGSVFVYLIACDYLFRAAAIEYCRSPAKWGYSKAMLHALRERGDIWNLELVRLEPRHIRPFLAIDQQNYLNPMEGFGQQVIGQGHYQQQQQQPQQPRGSRQQLPPPPQPNGNGTPSPKKVTTKNVFKTVRTAASGENICMRFNDQRGCTNHKCRFAHVCDVMLVKGQKACSASDHNRCGHNVSSHGKAVPMKG